MLERQVDETLEHAVEQHRLCRHPGHAVVRELTHQRVEFEHIHLVAGEPELHLDLILVQLLENHRGLSGTHGQRRLEQMHKPVTQRGDPAFPATAITTTANRIFHGLRRSRKSFTASPFEQTMKKSARVRTTRESMNIGTSSCHLSGRLWIEAFVVKQLLRLRTLRRFVRTTAQDVADAQGAVGGDPPIFTGLAQWDQWCEQCGGVQRRMVMLAGDVGHLTVVDRRTALLQIT
ncbi:hypothetical protein D3C84_254960 [compost metagenome]